MLLRRNPDHLRGPDAAFVTSKQLPTRTSPEGYLLTVPELIVELRSKNDTQPEIDEKVDDSQKAGRRIGVGRGSGCPDDHRLPVEENAGCPRGGGHSPDSP